jgi:hypothetical protein
MFVHTLGESVAAQQEPHRSAAERSNQSALFQCVLQLNHPPRQGGGMETTIMTSVTQLAHHGMIFVPPGD